VLVMVAWFLLSYSLHGFVCIIWLTFYLGSNSQMLGVLGGLIFYWELGQILDN